MSTARAFALYAILVCVATLLTSCSSTGAAYQNLIQQQRLVESGCIEEWESPRYDPVRGKLALSPYADELVRLQLNNNYPSRAEKSLVAEFGSLLYTCRASMAQLSSAISPEVSTRTVQQAQAELTEIVRLYNSKITYGEFNRRLAEISANRAATEAHIDRVAWQNLIAAERQRSSEFWESFMRGREEALRTLRKRQPMITRCTPGLMDEVVCTTSSTGY